MTHIQCPAMLLEFSPLGLDTRDGISATVDCVDVVLAAEPPEGIARVRIEQSSPCGSDVNPVGYYRSGRYHQDLFRNQEKLQENLSLLQTRGVLSPESLRRRLCHVPNHEGWGIITAIGPETIIPTSFPIFSPILSSAGTIQGFQYTPAAAPSLDLSVGDWVIGDAANRCYPHWIPEKGALFPTQCTRTTENGHIRKQVPGHTELPGYSLACSEGIPYPVSALTKVPAALREWIERDLTRKCILLSAEPTGCCFEAFLPLLLAASQNPSDSPSRIAIIGDGYSAAVLLLFLTSAFPNATVTLAGCNDSRMEALVSIAPKQIQLCHIDRAGNDSFFKSPSTDAAFDLVIPTYHVSDSDSFISMVYPSLSPNGHIILWSPPLAQRRTWSISNNITVHSSYGGLNKCELMALQFFAALLPHEESKLLALLSLRRCTVPIGSAGELSAEWLRASGRWSATTSSELQSATKLIFDHSTFY